MARVLVVEDYPPLAKVIAIAIQREGHQVDRVGSVARALTVSGSFDLAVIDLDLPDGVGTHLAEQLRGEGRLGPVIFFTSSSDPVLRGVAASQGRLIEKESGIEELMVWVRRELRQRERMTRAVGTDVSVAHHQATRSATRKRVR